MHLLPIISTLRRHRTAALLIVLEIAFTCAIVCNAVFLIGQRLSRMDAPSGLVESELVRVRLTGIGEHANPHAVTAEDMNALRAIGGVKSVVATNMIPFGGSSWNTSVSTKADDPNPPVNAAMYMGSYDFLETTGVKLVEGRDFTPEEYVQYEAAQKGGAKVASLIVSKHMGERLFPGQSAIGKQVYAWGEDPQTIVGVIDHIARPNEGNGAEFANDAMLFPVLVPYTLGGTYLLRVEPGRTAEVVAAVGAALDKIDSNRILLAHEPYAAVRREHFKQDRAMAWLLVCVSGALLIITALGVVGLASFWVQQRTRQIGVRRALGATRRDILRYFQLENFILATVGIVVGMAMAYGINMWLMDKYQVARLPAQFLPIGAVVLWLLGQIAVFGPASRASLIPPAIATRSV